MLLKLYKTNIVHAIKFIEISNRKSILKSLGRNSKDFIPCKAQDRIIR